MGKKNGFTMIEIIFYLAIIAVLVFASFFVLNTINQSRLKNQIISEVDYQGMLISQTLAQEIRNAKSINLDNQNELILQSDNIEKNPIVFNVSDGNFYIKEGSQERIKLNNSRVSVASLQIKNNSVSEKYESIKFSFVIAYTNKSGLPDYNYSKSFYGSASTRQEK